MHIRSAATVWRLAARRPLILLYHRVADLDVDPWNLAVRPADFERHLRLLSALYEIVPLSSLVPQTEPPPRRRQLAITFDDGYLDNFEVAWPILRRHGLPATFFISCSAVESGREFWWDALEGALLRPGNLPPDVFIAGERIHIDVRARTYSERDCFLHRSWKAGQPSPTARHRTFLSLWARLLDMKGAERDCAIEDLCRQVQAEPAARPTRGAMSPDQVRRLSSSPTVEIGAHGVSHRRLSSASPEEQRSEVVDSKRTLEALCSRPVTSFSYPFGGTDDYSATTLRIVREGGFHRACANHPSPLGDDCDRLQVPRCAVPPGNARLLLRHLASWLAPPNPPA